MCIYIKTLLVPHRSNRDLDLFSESQLPVGKKDLAMCYYHFSLAASYGLKMCKAMADFVYKGNFGCPFQLFFFSFFLKIRREEL